MTIVSTIFRTLFSGVRHVYLGMQRQYKQRITAEHHGSEHYSDEPSENGMDDEQAPAIGGSGEPSREQWQEKQQQQQLTTAAALASSLPLPTRGAEASSSAISNFSFQATPADGQGSDASNANELASWVYNAVGQSYSRLRSAWPWQRSVSDEPLQAADNPWAQMLHSSSGASASSRDSGRVEGSSTQSTVGMEMDENRTAAGAGSSKSNAAAGVSSSGGSSNAAEAVASNGGSPQLYPLPGETGADFLRRQIWATEDHGGHGAGVNAAAGRSVDVWTALPVYGVLISSVLFFTVFK